MTPKTLYQKIWEKHVVVQEKDTPAILYIDAHLLHEVTSPQAFANLRTANRTVRRKDLTFATVDHNVPTNDQYNIRDELSSLQIKTLERNCREFKIPLYGLDSPYQGIVHVIGPELGITQPGKTIVCGDSHTSTHGAFGALAFGIGTTEVEQVLATQCLIQNRMMTMEINITGSLGKGVTAKDVILTVLSQIGTKGGSGYCIEYRGEAIKGMNMDQRMTICNMSIEGGARAGMIAPDETTFRYLKGRKFVPQGTDFDKAVLIWKRFKSDDGAVFDKSITIDSVKIEPLVTWGTDPSTGIKISDQIPSLKDADTKENKLTMEKALQYMGLKSGMRMERIKIDYVFIGSCTNSRISDLRMAATLIRGKKVNSRVTAFVVPGSRQVKKEAEEEGLDRIFTDAGFQWRWSGCSACLAMNDDKIPSGKNCVSTSNRNYEGRQGPGSRTFLASPITAAASAIEGKIADPRKYL